LMTRSPVGVSTGTSTKGLATTGRYVTASS